MDSSGHDNASSSFFDVLYDVEIEYQDNQETQRDESFHMTFYEEEVSSSRVGDEADVNVEDTEEMNQSFSALDDDDEQFHTRRNLSASSPISSHDESSSSSRASSPRLDIGSISPITVSSTPIPFASATCRSPTNNEADPPDHVQWEGEGSGERLGRGWTGARGSRRINTVTEIYTIDEDVPQELSEAIKQADARNEARLRTINRSARALAIHNDTAETLFEGDQDALTFDWRTMDTFRGSRELFDPLQSGPTAATNTAYDAFRRYWDDGILQHIVSETNRYAATRAFPDWYDTNIHEILILFAFWMMLGVIRMPSIRSCFSEHPLLATTSFRSMFTRTRYERLCSCLHFVDDAQRTSRSSKLFDLGPIPDHLNSRFQSAYVPRQEICIDESLTLWKGRLSFRQCIKSKSARYGVKSFELCESATGYLWSFFIYCGKDHDGSTPASSLPKTTSSVLTLIRPLLNKGYTLFMDRWFNSPLLARFLKRNRTDVVGTLMSNRRHVPPLIELCRLQPGQIVARHSGDVMVMAYYDKKKVSLISTYHGVEVATTHNRPDHCKPQLVIAYNSSMGGVDLKDGMLEPYLLERKKCQYWYIKIFKRLLNCSILNSRICFEASIGARHYHTIFRLQLVEQILKSHLSLVPKLRRGILLMPPPRLPDERFCGNRHWPSTNAKRTAEGRTVRHRCALPGCTRLSTFECKLCNVSLCVNVCFGAYHTK